MNTTEIFLIAMTIIFTVPYLIWRVGRTDYYAPLVVVQIITGILLGPGILGKVLDAGAYAVICPMVNTRADAEQLVAATRYPPLGSRSMGPIRAALYAGAAYVPVDADDPDERARTVFAEADVRAVIGNKLEIDPRGPARPAVGRVDPSLDDDAWVIFTSGSTGKPKGVAVTHRNAAAFVDAEARIFLTDAPLGVGDRVMAGLSVAFDASCEEMWLAWRYGACLVPAPRSLVRSGMDLGPWLQANRITVISESGLYKLVMRSDKPQAKPFGQCLFLRPDRQCRFAALRHR